jgi:hypothetical protein
MQSQIGTNATACDLVSDVRRNSVEGVFVVTDEIAIRAQAHRQNIARYKSLFRTKLTAIERAFIDRRITEEEAAVRRLRAGARNEQAVEAAPARIPGDADATADDRMSPG